MIKKICIATIVMVVFTAICLLWQLPVFGVVAAALHISGKLLGCDGYAWANYIAYFCVIPAAWIFMAGNHKYSLKFLPAALMYLVGTTLIGYLFIDMKVFLKAGMDFCLNNPAPFKFLNTTPSLLDKWQHLVGYPDIYIANSIWWCVILPAFVFYGLALINIVTKKK